ncbi:MAG: hypothetical protein U0237_11295 [Thermoleophilia bacterium]
METDADAPTPPVRAADVLRWMGANGGRLRELVAEEGEHHPVRLPADDGCIRAHLRLLAEALEAAASPGLRERLEGFAGWLDDWFDDQDEEMAAHLARAEGAIALEQHLQWNITPGSDPSLDAGLERRLRIMGWQRLFAHGLEAHLGPAADGLAEGTLAWIGDHQRELGRLVISMGAHARAALGDVQASTEMLDEIGQAAAVRAHVRQLAESLEVSLSEVG